MLTHRIASDEGVILITGAGTLTTAEVEALWARIKQDPAYHGGLALLVDIRDASLSELTPDAMREVALAGSPQRAAARRAYVVSNDMQFGMIRMLAAFGDTVQPGREIRPFRDVAAARAWLAGKPGET